jgi:hypothetical protein
MCTIGLPFWKGGLAQGYSNTAGRLVVQMTLRTSVKISVPESSLLSFGLQAESLQRAVLELYELVDGEAVETDGHSEKEVIHARWLASCLKQTELSCEEHGITLVDADSAEQEVKGVRENLLSIVELLEKLLGAVARDGDA